MPGTHGKKTVFKLDTLANVLTDISAKLMNLDFPHDVELVETTTFGAAAKTFIVGFKDNKISLQGVWDSTIDAHLFNILGQTEATGQAANSAFDFEYAPQGTATGSPKYTGAALLVKYQRSNPINGAVKFSAELQISGDATLTSY